MKNYAKLPFEFDKVILQKELRELVTKWESHFNTAYYDGDWSGIPLRKPKDITHQVSPGNAASEDFEDTSILQQLPYTSQVLEAIEAPKLSIRYLRLTSGSVIKPHKDYDLVFEDGYVRLHIPIVTNDQVEFIVDNEKLELKSGECWFADFSKTHSVSNHGPTDRVHLVIDCNVNEWLTNLFKEIGILPLAEQAISPYDQYDEHTKKQMIEQFIEMGTETSLEMAEAIRKSMIAN